MQKYDLLERTKNLIFILSLFLTLRKRILLKSSKLSLLKKISIGMFLLHLHRISVFLIKENK